MGRPRLTVPVHRYYINLTLREGEDDDLIAFLANIPPRRRVKAIKTALRGGDLRQAAAGDGLDDDELAEELAEMFL